LGRRLAVAAAIFDGESAAVGKAGTLRDVHNPGARRALQQLMARALEADIAKHGAWRLAEKGQKLPLQVLLETPATAASSVTERV